jgi:hypothetical protein
MHVRIKYKRVLMKLFRFVGYLGCANSREEKSEPKEPMQGRDTSPAL